MHSNIKILQKSLLIQQQLLRYDTYAHVLPISQVSGHLEHW